jgi:SAM-dependent methyltransferase
MDQAEFDRFADEYRDIHARNIHLSGESPDFFAEYKIRDAAKLVAHAGLQHPLRVMDFGAGVGNSVPFYAKYLPHARLTCVDVSMRSLHIAETRFPGMAAYQLFDGNTLPFPEGSFDLAFTACVFHHIPAVEHTVLFAEIRRVLRPGGLFIIFEHNPRNPLTVRVVNTCPFDEHAVLIDAKALRARVAAAAFHDVQVAYRMFFPRMLGALRILEPMLTWLPLGAQYYVSARKADVG